MELKFSLGQRVLAAETIQGDADDYSDTGIHARRGDELIIKGFGISFDYFVHHPGRSGGFHVHESELTGI